MEMNISCFLQPMPDVEEYINSSQFRAFSGAGNRLDGKKKNTESAPVPVQPHEFTRWVGISQNKVLLQFAHY